MISLLLLSLLLAAPPAVQILEIPGGGVAPSVAVATDGTLHMVFGREKKAYYTRSTDEGKTFAEAVLLNQTSQVDAGGERGPRIALGRNGSRHVTWVGPRGHAVHYTRAGSSGPFAAERNLLERGEADGAVLAADPATGEVSVAWIDSRMGPVPDSPVSGRIFSVRSENDGQSFTANTQVPSDYPGGACACCTLDAGFEGPGRLLIAFRGGYRNLRDTYLLRAGRAKVLHEDGWKFEGCPMSGPRLSAGTGTPLVAWMSEGSVYFAREGGERKAPTAAAAGARNYPLAIANGKGEVLFAWTEQSKIRWEVYADGGALASSGESAMTRKSRPAAFVRRDGSFAILY